MTLEVEVAVGGQFVRIESPKTILERTPTAVKKPHHIVSGDAKSASARIQEFARANDQMLLPLI